MTTPKKGQSTKMEAWEWARNAFLPLSRSSLVWAALIAALLLLFVNFQPARFIGWVLGPIGKVYVSSPGVYTRERLVNDRNDEDFWLRGQLRLLDESQVGFSAVTRSDLRLTAEVSAMPAGGNVPSGQTADEAGGGASSAGGSSVQPSLPFLDSFAIRTAARDSIRQSILENLLDDRHDLTGNSVYGLKFDTTVIPGRFTTGRAYVRLSITPGEAELVPEEEKPDEKFPELPLHLRTYYQSTFSQIANDQRNANYNSFKLYSQWRSNVRWRLNSHFMQIVETKCQCKSALCSPPSAEWRAEVLSTVDTILAIDAAEMKSGQTSEGIFALNKIILPAPWNDFLDINVSMPKISDCSKVPVFGVNSVDDTIHVRAKGEKNAEYRLVDEVDDQESAYVYVPKSEEADWLSYWPHYRNVPSIVRYVKSINKQLTYCFDNTKKETCVGYVTIPSGYFNFIEKVIKPDMYAYSLFPRLEATSVLSAQSSSREARYSGNGANGGPAVGVDSMESSNEASLIPTAIGFTDAQSSKAVDLGWIVDVGRNGAPFQKSQFALISVPAWTSRLAISVRTGWLDSRSMENATESYSYAVPIPPDYEAFDSFIGGQESVRRPQINEELMDDNIKLVACRKAAILIPGLRLWRSAMVTVGSERADRITVLPNMRGIIAEFTRLSRVSATGDATLRVWTSEGVDSLPNKVSINPPENPADCEDKLSQPATPPPKVSAPPASPKPN